MSVQGLERSHKVFLHVAWASLFITNVTHTVHVIRINVIITHKLHFPNTGPEHEHINSTTNSN